MADSDDSEIAGCLITPIKDKLEVVVRSPDGLFFFSNDSGVRVLGAYYNFGIPLLRTY